MLPQIQGLIDLGDKQTPSDFLPPHERPTLKCMSLLSDDIGPAMARLEARVRALPKSAWTREGQRATNVCINRPYHDRLGIFNIPFIFCDDGVRTVYHFPWFKKWLPELTPIFEHLNLDPARLLRCVMARLPAGVTIPTHHDTGHWVQVAHRVHCPVITNPQVFFYAGHSQDTLERFQLPLGCAVELNNAAKHRVENLGASDRVHLMLDFVDPPTLPHAVRPFPPVVRLKPTDTLVQTRRTLRLAHTIPPRTRRTEGNKEFPLCIIVGAMKAGTTSLYVLLRSYCLACFPAYLPLAHPLPLHHSFVFVVGTACCEFVLRIVFLSLSLSVYLWCVFVPNFVRRRVWCGWVWCRSGNNQLNVGR